MPTINIPNEDATDIIADLSEAKAVVASSNRSESVEQTLQALIDATIDDL